jgi:hypothetical protein
MVAGYYTDAYWELLVWSGYVVIVNLGYILGIHQGIVKLYPTSKGLLDTLEMEPTYLITHTCDHFQTEGEAEGEVVRRTMQE